jgi:hypothetical protein
MSSILIRAATVDGPDSIAFVDIPSAVDDKQVASLAKEFVGLHAGVPVRNGLSAVTVIRIGLNLSLPKDVPECLVDPTNIPDSLRESYLSVEDSSSPTLCASALLAFLSKKTGHEFSARYDSDKKPDDRDVLAEIVFGSLEGDIQIEQIERCFP